MLVEADGERCASVLADFLLRDALGELNKDKALLGVHIKHALTNGESQLFEGVHKRTRSVMMRLTQRGPVMGSEHFSRILGLPF